MHESYINSRAVCPTCLSSHDEAVVSLPMLIIAALASVLLLMVFWVKYLLAKQEAMACYQASKGHTAA